MRKHYFSIFVFLLFLLVSASITRAQTISSQKGLTTAVFTTSSGTIKVYLPDDIRQGDVISGRVIAEPDGKNEKQLQRNLAELVKYSIGLNGEKFAVENAAKIIRFTVPADKPMQNSLHLLNVNGTSPVQQLTIPAKPVSEQKPAPVQCIIPGHVVTGSPLIIQGPFDGNAGNTQCTIGNQPATILAESPRSSIVAFPANANGMQQTQVQENGQQPCSKNVSGVDMNVTAGKLNLTKGENTYIDVSITGLQNLQAPALLLLNNLTTDIVAMQPSNNIAVPLVPDSVSSGNFNRRFNVQSIRTGGFAVNVNLDFQDIMMTPIPEDPKPEDPKNDNKVPDGGNGGKTDPPKVVIEPDDPKNPITWDTLPRDITACNPTLSHLIGRSMDGGLRNSFIGLENSKTIKRDDFIVLEADGVDFDIAVIKCTKIEICPQPGCTKEIPMEGVVRFEWEATSPKGKETTRGSFVQVGCIPDDTKAKGEHVIFKPPYVPLPTGKGVKETTVSSTINLSIIDAGSPVPDKTITKTITISITRSKSDPELYTVKITGGGYRRGEPPVTIDKGCPCNPIGPFWNAGDNLKDPEILLPAESGVGDKLETEKEDDKLETDIREAEKLETERKEKIKIHDNDKLVLGQWAIVSTQDQTDMDVATYGCATTCPTTTIKKSYNDVIRWKWKVKEEAGKDMGRILLSDSSQFIVYEAPKTFLEGTEFLDITITAEVYNPADRKYPSKQSLPGEKLPPMKLPGRSDPTKKNIRERVFRVYKPGVKLSTVKNDWVPTNDESESVEITSSLMIKEGETWKPAPAHTCRIHYFDLFDVSNEPGVCMNSPLPAKANSCRDLKIKNEKGHEAYDTAKQAGCPDNTPYFMQARTQKPEHSYTINIYSEDFGSWGFLRSFANVNEESKKQEEQKPENPHFKKPGITIKEVEEIDEGLKVYNTKLAAYYQIKDQKIKQQVPKYESIPITMADVSHPTNQANAKYDYTDNRVSIPLDIDQNHIPDRGWTYLIVEEKTGNKITTHTSTMPDYPIDIKADWDNEPKGDDWVGDGLTLYEEYRGFMVAVPGLKHQRTSPNTKDLFVDNKNGLPIEAFVKATGITLHQIDESQYSPITGAEVKTVKDWGFSNRRFINFNYCLAHQTHQKGLYVRDSVMAEEGLLGITPPETEEKGDRETPAPPNWNNGVYVDIKKIKTICKNTKKKNLKEETKLPQIVAHELCHALNVYHHGEKNMNPGLNSGNEDCVMRYDNTGNLDEAPGNILCIEQGSANQDKHRGSCAFQIRVSGRKDPAFPTRGYPQRK